MTTPITVPVTFPGVADSQTAMLALAQAVAGLANNVATLGTKQQQQSQTQTQATTSAQQATQQAIQFGQRLAGVANAVQNLTARFGAGSGTAGLIGSIANTTTQFAQMGAALGPGGAVAGAVVGFTASLYELRNAHTAVAEAAHAQQTAEADLAAAARQGQEDTTHGIALQLQTQRRLIQAHQEELADLTSTTATTLARIADTANPFSRQQEVIAARVATLRQMLDGERALESQFNARLAGGGNDDPTGLGGLHYGPNPTARATAGDVARETGPASSTQATAHTGGETDQQAIAGELADARERAATAAQQAAEQYATILDQQNKLLAEQLTATQALEQAKTEESSRAHDTAEKEAAQHHAYEQQLAHFHEQERRWAQQESQLRAQQTQEAQTATSAVLSNLTNVFTLMAEGQANAAQGAELLLAGFLQYISQRATIEALAQVAQGIGSYPDFGGMALHFAAAAAWGAVAVATGVGGSALASDAQSKGAAAQAQAQQPAAPQHSSGDGGKGGSVTNIINWNSPVPMTAQQAQNAVRPLRRMLDQSAQRYAGG